ncbi:MAG: CPBP family glutamic-type intramembrane protease [Actinomycetota bacterium]
MSTPTPGWYPDPYQPEWRRYWDGRRWTGDVAVPQTVPPPPRPTLPFPVAIGAIVAIAIPLTISRVLLRHLAQYEWPVVVYLVIATVLAYVPPLIFWVYASQRWGSGFRRLDVGLLVKWKDLGWGPVTWLACFGAEVAMAVVVKVTHVPFQNNTESLRDLHDRRGYVVAMLLLAVLIAPIVEEIIFRGLVLRGLQSRMGPVAAIVLQGVLFGMAHISPERGMRNVGLVMVLSAVGVVLGTSAYLLRRLGPTMIAHAIMNGIAMAIVLSGWTPAGT